MMSMVPKKSKKRVQKMKSNEERWVWIHSKITNHYEYVIKLSKFLENYVLKLACTGRLGIEQEFGFYPLKWLLNTARDHCRDDLWHWGELLTAEREQFLLEFTRNTRVFLSIRNDFTHKMRVAKLSSTQRNHITQSFTKLVKALTRIRQEQKNCQFQSHKRRSNTFTVQM